MAGSNFSVFYGDKFIWYGDCAATERMAVRVEVRLRQEVTILSLESSRNGHLAHTDYVGGLLRGLVAGDITRVDSDA